MPGSVPCSSGCECKKHRKRVLSEEHKRRIAEAHTGKRQDEVGYYGAHDRVTTERGPAKNYECIECIRQARHWCYNHLDPDERYEEIYGYWVAYSMDPEFYDPRCVSCHALFDRSLKDR